MRASLKKVFFGLLFVAYPAIAKDLPQADFPVEIVLQNAPLRINDSVSLRRVCVSFSEYFNNSEFWRWVYKAEKGHEIKSQDTFEECCKRAMKPLLIKCLAHNTKQISDSPSLTAQDRLNFSIEDCSNLFKPHNYFEALQEYFADGSKILCINYDWFQRCGDPDGVVNACSKMNVLPVFHATQFNWVKIESLTNLKGIWTTECNAAGEIGFKVCKNKPGCINIAVRCPDEEFKKFDQRFSSLGLAPLVIAEFAAHLFILRPDLTPNDIVKILIISADKTKYDYGIFNSDEAIRTAQSYKK